MIWLLYSVLEEPPLLVQYLFISKKKQSLKNIQEDLRILSIALLWGFTFLFVTTERLTCHSKHEQPQNKYGFQGTCNYVHRKATEASSIGKHLKNWVTLHFFKGRRDIQKQLCNLGTRKLFFVVVWLSFLLWSVTTGSSKVYHVYISCVMWTYIQLCFGWLDIETECS